MGKLNFNESALRYLAQHRPPDREGRLLYRKSSDSYRERWFRLCGNLLFYFRTNEMGAIADTSDPVGVLVLARCQAQIEVFGDRPFVFSLVFDGEDGRKHFFSGQSQQHCEEWVAAIRTYSHSAVQSQLESLRQKIRQMTGKDPLVTPPLTKTDHGIKQSAAPVVKRHPPAIPPPPASYRAAATFYVDRAPVDVTGQDIAASSSSATIQPARPPRSKPARRAETLQPSSTSADGVSPRTNDSVKPVPADASNFNTWEKFS